AVQDNGIEVDIGDGVHGFIRKAELARDRADQRPDRFAIGEKIDAKVTAIDRATRKIALSIKSREVEEEKQAMADYGSSDSGAALGDILGAAIRQARQKDVPEPKPKKTKAAKAEKAEKDDKEETEEKDESEE